MQLRLRLSLSVRVTPPHARRLSWLRGHSHPIKATLETWHSMASSAALLYAWPGPIYEGNGECQAVIDERADGKQRDALATILYGGETNEGATHWWVYTKMSSTVHPPLFKHIEFDVNIERRKARIVISDVLESIARPIRSPATGAEHRVRINLPNGIEYDLAEIGSGTTKTMASIALDLKDTYFHFNALRQSGKGVVHSR